MNIILQIYNVRVYLLNQRFVKHICNVWTYFRIDSQYNVRIIKIVVLISLVQITVFVLWYKLGL